MTRPHTPPSTIAGISRRAKRISRERGVKHTQALNEAAIDAGYKSFKHAQRQLSAIGSRAASPPLYLSSAQHEGDAQLLYEGDASTAPSTSSGGRLKDVCWESLAVVNSGLGFLRGNLLDDRTLLVENTSEAKLMGFLDGLRCAGDFLKNPENLLIVINPSAFAGGWQCKGRANWLADPFTHPPFIFEKAW